MNSFLIGAAIGLPLGIALFMLLLVIIRKREEKRNPRSFECTDKMEYIFDLLEKRGVIEPRTKYLKDHKRKTILVLSGDRVTKYKFNAENDDIETETIPLSAELHTFAKKYFFWGFRTSGMFSTVTEFICPDEE